MTLSYVSQFSSQSNDYDRMAKALHRLSEGNFDGKLTSTSGQN